MRSISRERQEMLLPYFVTNQMQFFAIYAYIYIIFFLQKSCRRNSGQLATTAILVKHFLNSVYNVTILVETASQLAA